MCLLQSPSGVVVGEEEGTGGVTVTGRHGRGAGQELVTRHSNFISKRFLPLENKIQKLYDKITASKYIRSASTHYDEINPGIASSPLTTTTTAAAVGTSSAAVHCPESAHKHIDSLSFKRKATSLLDTLLFPLFDRHARHLSVIATLVLDADSSSNSNSSNSSSNSSSSGEVYFLRAAEFVQKAIASMVASGRYLCDDVVVGREGVKLAQLYYNGGDHGRCLEALEKCTNILQGFLAENDPDWLTCKRLRMLLLNVKKLGR